MTLLYGLLLFMLVVALAIVAIPFLQQSQLRFRWFILIAICMSASAFFIYALTGNKVALNEWLTHGEQHYQLLEKFNALGGVDGAIVRIKKSLQENPLDAQGWLILAKLYVAKQDHDAALKAIKEARKIAPKDPEIIHYEYLLLNK
jgi:cytochrome c-type biogenesis protein CcmH/NrfG